MRPVRHLGCDLDPTVHWARVHDDDVGLGAPQPGAVDAVEPRVLADRRKEVLRLALRLDAQQVQHVVLADGRVEVVVDRHAELGESRRDERGRAADADLGPHGPEREEVAPGDPAVRDVAHEEDLQPREPSARRPDRVEVEEGLRRVLVRAVPGVDDAHVEDTGEEVRRARRRVAPHDDVHAHGLDVLRGVGERFALGGAPRGHREVERVGGEALGRQPERGPRAGRGLEEEVHGRAAAQRWLLLGRARRDLAERGRGVEDGGDLLARQVLAPEEVAAGPAEGGRRAHRAPFRGSTTTSSAPSTSRRRTATVSSGRTVTTCAA